MTVFALTLGFFTLCLWGRAVAQQGHDFRHWGGGLCVMCSLDLPANWRKKSLSTSCGGVSPISPCISLPLSVN